MREYARQAVLAERERFARICEEIALNHQKQEGSYPAGKKAGALECASAIRSS
jgi:hypothetical protein